MSDDKLRARLMPTPDGGYEVTFYDGRTVLYDRNYERVIKYGASEGQARLRATEMLAELRRQRDNLARPSFEVTE